MELTPSFLQSGRIQAENCLDDALDDNHEQDIQKHTKWWSGHALLAMDSHTTLCSELHHRTRDKETFYEDYVSECKNPAREPHLN